MEAVELVVEARFLIKTVTMEILFELQHLKQFSESSEALFPSHYWVAIVSVVYLMAAGFPMVRFLRQHG